LLKRRVNRKLLVGAEALCRKSACLIFRGHSIGPLPPPEILCKPRSSNVLSSRWTNPAAFLPARAGSKFPSGGLKSHNRLTLPRSETFLGVGAWRANHEQSSKAVYRIEHIDGHVLFDSGLCDRTAGAG